MSDPSQRTRRRFGRLKRSSQRYSSGRARTTHRPPRRIGILTALACTFETRSAHVASSAAVLRASGPASAPSSDGSGRGTPRSAPPDSSRARRAAQTSGASARCCRNLDRHAARPRKPAVVRWRPAVGSGQWRVVGAVRHEAAGDKDAASLTRTSSLRVASVLKSRPTHRARRWGDSLPPLGRCIRVRRPCGGPNY